MNKEKILKIFKNTASLVVILAMFVIVFYQNRDRDIFKFGQSESDNIISSDQKTISGFSIGDIKKLGEKVAFLTTTSYSVHDKDRDSKTVNVAFSQPILHTEDTYAVCYEHDSTSAYVFKDSSEVYSINTDNKIFLAKINKNGYLLIATEKDGYNCECMVYNHNGEPIFKWDISKSEFIDGDINQDNNAIALSLASSGDNELVGKILLINITNAKVVNESSYNSSVFFSVDFNNNGTFVALGNSSLNYFNSDGTEKWSYGFNGKKLFKADISNHDTMILAFSGTGEMFDGNSTEIKAINKLGKSIGEITLDGHVDDLSVGNSCAAIAVDKKVYVLDAKMQEKKTLKTDYSIKKVILFSDDSSVFVLGSSGGEILN